METSLSEIFVATLYGLIGLLGMLSMVVLAWGFIEYISRLGTLRREAGLHVMVKAVRLIITTLLLIGFLHLVQGWQQ